MKLTNKLKNKAILIGLFGIIFFIGILWIFDMAVDRLSCFFSNNIPYMQRGNIPEFYNTLALDKEDFSIIEYPIILQKCCSPFFYYQSFHRKKIINGYFLSHALKKRWNIGNILDTDVWPAEIILSRMENNKINFSNIIDLFANFIDLYNINAIRNSKAKYIILHKQLKDEIITKKDDIIHEDKELVNQINNDKIWKHIYKSSLHFKRYYQRYFGEPIYEDKWLVVFQTDSSFFLAGCNKTLQKEARVTFQFDHPYISQYLIAKPIFDSKGIKATLMINTDVVGTNKYYMSWSQLIEMYNEGWEIGAHSVSHPNLHSKDEMTIRYELLQSKTVLEDHGFRNVNNFAYPYNIYDIDIVYIISDYFRSARTSISETDFNVNPQKIHPYELSSYIANITFDNLTDTYKYIDEAKKKGRWLIFLLHEFRDRGGKVATFSKDVTDINALEKMIDYIQYRKIPIVLTEQSLDYYIGETMCQPIYTDR